MAYEVGNAQGHYDFLTRIAALATLNGWQVLRNDTSEANHELILRGPGLSGSESIFVGFKTLQGAPGSDVFNIRVGTMLSYNAGLPYDNQEGLASVTVPCTEHRLDYWLCVNGQRIMFTYKIGTTYEHGYAGKFFPYTRPAQHPNPLLAVGMLSDGNTSHFSSTASNHSVGYDRLRNTRTALTNSSNNVVTVVSYPWGSALAESNNGASLKDNNGKYPLVPIELISDDHIWGAVDGVYFVPGYNNRSENIVTVAGQQYIVFQNAFRNGFVDYYAMRLN